MTKLTQLRRKLAKIKAKQEAYFQKHHRLLTPYDGEFWAITQAIAELKIGGTSEHRHH